MGIPVLEKALSINPNLINAGNWLAMSSWGVNRAADSIALLDDLTTRDPLYKPAMGNRVFMMALMGRGDEARAYLDSIAPFMPGDPNIESSRAWIDAAEGESADALLRMQAALELQPTDRVYRVGVNQGNYETHQYDLVVDDEFSDYVIWALFNRGQNEEATLIAQKRASDGVVQALFAFLNASDQSEAMVKYFEERWTGIDDFQEEIPASVFGYREMADIAFAYRRTGNQDRFDEAMAVLGAANQQSMAQGMQGGALLMVVAAQHAMAGETDEALKWLAHAIDGGVTTSSKISKEYPYFRDLDGNPEYEAIQARMIEHLNRERAQLGLDPVST
jgi:tetratricopeptide (TPR) repeat protein